MKNIFFLWILFSFSACSQSMMQEKIVFEYKIRMANKPSSKPPLLIMLHGYGSNEDDLFSYAPYLDERFVIVAARGPFEHSQGNFAWYSIDFSQNPYISNNIQAEESRQWLGKFIDQITVKYDCDASQVYLLGFSQGAMMSLSCALTMPDRVRGAIVLSGKLRDEIKPLVADAKHLQNTNIYIGHGKTDTRVAYEEANKMQTFLVKMGIFPTLYTFEEGHTVTENGFLDFSQWLKKAIEDK